MLQDSKTSVSVFALLAGLASVPACAQTTAATANSSMVETVTVTGYRASLQSAATAKQTATNFSDSVFAEDIGKFPDLNIAEAINRIPGIQLARDSSGEGVQITVRGMNPSFTNVLMNGHPIAVATDGSLSAGNQNRELDLDMFPIELFTRVTVNKTPSGSTYEGGIGGTVNLATIKPLDSGEEGFHANYGLQGEYNDPYGSLSPRGSLIARYNWNNKLGILFGFAGQHYKFRTDSYSNTGNALADVVSQQPAGSCPTCNTIGTGKNFRWATVVPAGVTPNAALGIGAAGTAYAYAGGASAGGTSGLSTADLSNTIFPYLAAEGYSSGTKDRMSFLTDVQWRASEQLEFNLNVLYEFSQRVWGTGYMEWYARNTCNTAGTAANCMIPVGLQRDSMGYLTKGTFLNSSWFLATTATRENIGFMDVNPTVSWTPTPWLKVQGSVDYNDSYINRRNWGYLVQTTPGTGITVDFVQKPGADMPTITTNAPLNDPASNTWQWYQVRTQPLYRDTVNKGTEWNATIGDDSNNIKVGYAYNSMHRYIDARDNGAMAQTCVMGTGACTMPDGSTRAAGNPLVSNAQLSQYLTKIQVGGFLQSSDGSNGYGDFIGLSKGLDQATHITDFMETAPFSTTGAFGAQKSGAFTENTQNGYIDVNGLLRIVDRDVHLNGGLRYYNTTQIITGPVNVGGVYQFLTNQSTYQGVLPSFNMSVDVIDNLVFRAAASRTMTRAQPSAMLPGFSFGSALLSPISKGNEDLKPYFSNNLDLGLEWYTGGPGLVAINYFRKDISNFTTTSTITQTFGQTGIPLSILTPTQIADYNSNGGMNASVQVTTTINLQQNLHLEGFELNYVQPLDFALEGLGVSGTFTSLTHSVDAGLAPTVAQGLALGIARYTYNLGGYYENNGFTLHVNWNYVARTITMPTPAQQGIQQPGYGKPYGQLDMSASYQLGFLDGTMLEGSMITLDIQNLTQSDSMSYIGSPNNVYGVTYRGAQYILGFRGKF
jgi:TonB-dependent receptor